MKRASSRALALVVLSLISALFGGTPAGAVTGAPSGRILLLHCHYFTSVTAVVIDVATARVVRSVKFPTPSNGDFSVDPAYDCRLGSANMPPAARRWMLDKSLTHLAVTITITVNGGEQSASSVAPNGDLIHYDVVDNDETGKVDSVFFNSTGRAQWRYRGDPIVNGTYAAGRTEIRTAPATGGSHTVAQRAPLTGPKRIRPYFLGLDGASRVATQELSADEDIVPGNWSPDGWPSPDGNYHVSYLANQDSSTFKVHDGHGRTSGTRTLPCVPSAWLTSSTLLCGSEPAENVRTGIWRVHLAPNGSRISVTAARYASTRGWRAFDAIRGPGASYVAAMRLANGVPQLMISDAHTGVVIKTLRLASGGGWRTVVWTA